MARFRRCSSSLLSLSLHPVLLKLEILFQKRITDHKEFFFKKKGTWLSPGISKNTILCYIIRIISIKLCHLFNCVYFLFDWKQVKILPSEINEIDPPIKPMLSNSCCPKDMSLKMASLTSKYTLFSTGLFDKTLSRAIVPSKNRIFRSLK
ncbi:hypothetical protein J3Q64DRAFT_1701518 [Phycomyces blakesleeanus]|uniref:Uncharacterized protein n=2 Tax=Phycomyces blakesleeanus TaxID=4837 RepID=A0A167KYT4_PHYB8|nr:hypothetical protein PHYBLDRAFT_172443 [Phycomyces blakesleeanus NRRL 1555(-)]OAD69188.1 hypothetical protein PHYBLDRAFT_172443 [Phycomyces blakesleeanus NRRL 1555(-)]|eukprot:XP_018287228.1 hypothetical protein PHYBLDRAFT_172443 [Phycomyces blakesleeanus NRRL 1555(-)]